MNCPWIVIVLAAAEGRYVIPVQKTQEVARLLEQSDHAQQYGVLCDMARQISMKSLCHNDVEVSSGIKNMQGMLGITESGRVWYFSVPDGVKAQYMAQQIKAGEQSTVIPSTKQRTSKGQIKQVGNVQVYDLRRSASQRRRSGGHQLRA